MINGLTSVGKPNKASNIRHSKVAQSGRKSQNLGAGTTLAQNLVNELTGGRITTPYPGKYKTVMCRFYI